MFLTRSWQRGLLWIPALYLAFVGVLFYSRSISTRATRLKAAIEQAGDAFDRARVRRDLKEIIKANDELEALTGEARSLQTASFTLIAVTAVGMAIFIWATWQVTHFPLSRWERFARWGVLLVPVLAVLVAVTHRHVLLQIAQKVVSIGISIGHHHALHKIAAISGSRDVMERIDWIYRSAFRLLLLLVLLPLTGMLQQAPPWVRASYEEILLGIAGLFVIALAFALWTLRRRLLAFQSRGSEEMEESLDEPFPETI